MSESDKNFHCGGCGENYSRESEVTDCSKAHAAEEQKRNEATERAQMAAKRQASSS